MVEQDKYGRLFHAIASTIHGKFLAKRRVVRRVRVAVGTPTVAGSISLTILRLCVRVS